MINNKLDGSGDRLRELRKKMDMTQTEFSNIIKSSYGHISDMEKDRKNITDSTIELLKTKCNVNENWLRYGTGEMFMQLAPDDEYIRAAAEISKSDDLLMQQILIEYFKLNSEGKKQLKDFIINIAENIKKEE